MTEDILDRLQSISLDVLTDVVRQDQRRSSLIISDWAVQPLSDKGIINPGGLWALDGHARAAQGPYAWSLVIKVLRRPQHERSPSNPWYWKREVDFVQSAIASRLPGPIRAPRFYRVDEHRDDVWVWMERVRLSSSEPWTPDDFRRIAHDLGRWNGACLTQFGFPTEPWLARHHYLTVMEDSTAEDWAFPLNQKYLSPSIRTRHTQLLAERERFSHALDALPHTFAHLDAQHRNVLLREGATGQPEVVLIDWADCGVAPLGAELNALVGTSSLVFGWPPAQVRQLDQIVFASYLDGLAASGWSGDARQARLGYVGWCAMYYGRIFPGFLRYWCRPDNRSFALQQFGMAEEELYVQWLPFLDYVFECADEAHELIATSTIP
jgi:hypothetical protein